MKKMIMFLFLLIPGLLAINSCKDQGVVEPEIETLVDNYPWQYGTLQELGLKDSLINMAFNEAQTVGSINGIVIIRNGKIAAEKYYRNTNTNTVFDLKSATKSFTSALTGNAIKRNYFTLDTKLVDVFPEYGSVTTDARINRITVRHLLTMTSGIKSDDYIYPNYARSNDWVSMIMALQLDYEPGSTYRYSDAGVYLLSAIITRKTNQDTFNFAKSTIFNYLNIDLKTWASDSKGVPFGGAGMQLTVKAMATLGVLFLNKGVFNFRPVVPEDWVAASLTDYTGWQGHTKGKMTNIGYGYLWWLGKLGGQKIFAAEGYGGQMVVCVPDLNLVIATSAPSDVDDQQAYNQAIAIYKIMADYIIPAAR